MGASSALYYGVRRQAVKVGLSQPMQHAASSCQTPRNAGKQGIGAEMLWEPLTPACTNANVSFADDSTYSGRLFASERILVVGCGCRGDFMQQ